MIRNKRITPYQAFLGLVILVLIVLPFDIRSLIKHGHFISAGVLLLVIIFSIVNFFLSWKRGKARNEELKNILLAQGFSKKDNRAIEEKFLEEFLKMERPAGLKASISHWDRIYSKQNNGYSFWVLDACAYSGGFRGVFYNQTFFVLQFPQKRFTYFKVFDASLRNKIDEFLGRDLVGGKGRWVPIPTWEKSFKILIHRGENPEVWIEKFPWGTLLKNPRMIIEGKEDKILFYYQSRQIPTPDIFLMVEQIEKFGESILK